MGKKGYRWIGVTTLVPSCTECLEILGFVSAEETTLIGHISDVVRSGRGSNFVAYVVGQLSSRTRHSVFAVTALDKSLSIV